MPNGELPTYHCGRPMRWDAALLIIDRSELGDVLLVKLFVRRKNQMESVEEKSEK